MRHLIQIVEGATPAPRLTPNFTRWFGNSKVVNPDGSPLMVHHGSNAHAYVGGEIGVFHTLPSSGRGAAFFSASKSLAGEYGEKLYSVFLHIENPLVVFGDGKSWESLGPATKVAGRVTDELRAFHRADARKLNDLLRELGPLLGDDPSEIGSQIPDDVDDLEHLALNIMPGAEGQTVATDTIVKQARRMGYDGVVFKNIIDSPTGDRSLYKNTASDVYAVFRPSQIKSIRNNGEWDQDDPDINS